MFPSGYQESSRAFYVEEGVWVHVTSRGAFASEISYVLGGIRYETMVENEELIFSEEEEDDGL